MPSVGYPTFDQLKVLTVVADTGSFSAAARRLSRAQSVISYTIAQLEENLGTVLFDRSGRMPRLTDAGQALLVDARRASASVDAMRARAAGLQRGLEADVRLSVDVMFPSDRLVAALEGFAAQFPTVTLHLFVEALGGVAELVATDQCSLGISTDLPAMPDTMRQVPIGTVELLPVASPSHALARAEAPVGRDAVREATQIVLSDRSPHMKGQDFAVLSLKTWRVGDLAAKHALLRAGLGWGNMPALMIQDDLGSGRLVRLDLAEGRTHAYPLNLIHRADTLPGPAARWLADHLRLDEP